MYECVCVYMDYVRFRIGGAYRCSKVNRWCMADVKSCCAAIGFCSDFGKQTGKQHSKKQGKTSEIPCFSCYYLV